MKSASQWQRSVRAEEEKTTDETLTDIAKTAVNQQAEAA
jgi:ferritin-like metal-binding protein YciE